MKKISLIKKKPYYISKKGFSTFDDHKIRDHCHCTEKYRGAAHSICHLR